MKTIVWVVNKIILRVFIIWATLQIVLFTSINDIAIVSGSSMEPAIRNGQVLVCSEDTRWLWVGDIVVTHPILVSHGKMWVEQQSLCKRIISIREDGYLELRGDNVDHTWQGFVHPSQIRSKVTKEIDLDWPFIGVDGRPITPIGMVE